jgi:hypothetical protein
MVESPDIEWPDDLQCGECGAAVGDDGVKIHYTSLAPTDPELYAWCGDHAPETVEEENELWQRVKKGELREQAQSWEDY